MLPEMESYKGIVFPQKPAFHVVAAAVPIERRCGEFLPIVGDWNLPDCPVEKLEEWDSQGLISFDLGPERYDLAGNGFSSALEFVAVRLGLELTRGERKLVEVLAKHNTAHTRGYLNKFHMSVPWMCRELMEFPEYNSHDHIRQVMHVIHTWLRQKDQETKDNTFGRTTESLQEEFGTLFVETKAKQSDIFTAGQYLSNLWLMGEPSEEIWPRILYWVHGWKRLQKEIHESRNKFTELPKNWFMAGGLRGLAIETSSKFISKLAVRNCEVLAVLNPDTGHVAILTNGLDVSELAGVLQEKEPGRWYSTTGWLINGGSSFTGVTPTSLWSQIPVLVQKHPPVQVEPSDSERKTVQQVLRK